MFFTEKCYKKQGHACLIMQHITQFYCPRPLYPLPLSGGENWERKETKEPTKAGAGGTSYNTVKNIVCIFVFYFCRQKRWLGL